MLGDRELQEGGPHQKLRGDEVMGTSASKRVPHESAPLDAHHDNTFQFLRADVLRQMVLESGPSLPKCQDIRKWHPHWLVRIAVSSADACHHALQGRFLIISHCWEQRDQPDPDGTQLACIVDFVKKHQHVEYVWFDFWCLPQGKRSPMEEREFLATLSRINWLYLGASVLILCDMSYLSRFWTQYEAWLSMQQATTDGLVPARARGLRARIMCIHNAEADVEGEKLKRMWRDATCEKAYGILSRPDVRVTNQKDKLMHLPKIQSMSKAVSEALSSSSSVLSMAGNQASMKQANDKPAVEAEQEAALEHRSPNFGSSASAKVAPLSKELKEKKKKKPQVAAAPPRSSAHHPLTSLDPSATSSPPAPPAPPAPPGAAAPRASLHSVAGLPGPPEFYPDPLKTYIIYNTDGNRAPNQLVHVDPHGRLQSWNDMSLRQNVDRHFRFREVGRNTDGQSMYVMYKAAGRRANGLVRIQSDGTLVCDGTMEEANDVERHFVFEPYGRDSGGRVMYLWYNTDGSQHANKLVHIRSDQQLQCWNDHSLAHDGNRHFVIEELEEAPQPSAVSDILSAMSPARAPATAALTSQYPELLPDPSETYIIYNTDGDRAPNQLVHVDPHGRLQSWNDMSLRQNVDRHFRFREVGRNTDGQSMYVMYKAAGRRANGLVRIQSDGTLVCDGTMEEANDVERHFVFEPYGRDSGGRVMYLWYNTDGSQHANKLVHIRSDQQLQCWNDHSLAFDGNRHFVIEVLQGKSQSFVSSTI